MTYRILTVCTGNICRSPMAEYQLRAALDDAGLDEQVEVASAGTTSYEEGNPVDPRAGARLRGRGLDPSGHRARAVDREELERTDLVLALDHDHVRPLERLLGEEHGDRLRLLRSFDPDAGDDHGIRDPWFGDERDFLATEQQTDAALPGIVEHVRAALRTEGAEPRA